MPTTTSRERVHQHAERAGFAVRQSGIFDHLQKGDVSISVMYTNNGAVLRAHFYGPSNPNVPAASISATESGKVTKLINWLTA